MEVRGSITDRPWGLTLGAIALRRHTGQLTIDSDGKRYCIAFEDGAVVAATSPQAADAIARIALTNHFITSTQVADITRRLAMSPDRDEVDVLAEAIRFTPDQALRLRHRLVAQRAARTFSLEHGEFVLDDRIALPVFPGVAVDHRHVIYLGVRTHLAEQRLVDDLRQLGVYFVLKPEAIDELPRYGFEPAAHTVLEALQLGSSLPELEATHRELDPRFAQAIIYALVSCTACVIPPRTAQAPAPAPAPRPIPTHDATPRLIRGHLHPAPQPPSGSPTAQSSTAAQDAGTNTPAAMRARTTSEIRPPTGSAALASTASVARRALIPGPSAIQTPPPGRSAARPPSPPLRPAISRAPTPSDSELRGFGEQRTPSGFGEQRTPSAQRTPTDPSRPRTPTGGPLPSRVTTEDVAAAEAAFKRGELAMKRDRPGEAVVEFKTACDLNPNEADHAGMLAWARFCAAGDKAAVGADTRKALERAIYKSNKPERPRFYLGRVERMLGRDKEALRHFQEVLDLKPNHADAASEIRAIEARMQAGGKTGLFGRKR